MCVLPQASLPKRKRYCTGTLLYGVLYHHDIPHDLFYRRPKDTIGIIPPSTKAKKSSRQETPRLQTGLSFCAEMHAAAEDSGSAAQRPPRRREEIPAPRPPLHPPHIFSLGSRTSSSGAAAVSDRRQLEMAVPPRTFLYGSPPRPGRWRSRAPLTAFGSIRRGAPAPRPVRSRPRCRIPTGKAGLFGRAPASPKTAPALAPLVEWLLW
jgi:hypothetical protein